MSRTRALVLPALLLGAYATAAWGPGGALPVFLRLGMAVGGLLLLPGLALLRLSSRPPGGAWLSAGWAIGMGVAWNGALLLLCRAAHADFRALVWASPVGAVLLWLAAARRPVAADPEARWGAGARAALLAALAVAFLHGARMGTPIGYYSDSPDHIGTIRRMLATGDMFPQDAFFKDAGAQGADPRKGLWHPQVALLCLAAHADPLDAWVGLSAWLGPMLVLNAAALGFAAGGAAAAALTGWILLLTLGGSLAEQYFREGVFSTRLGDSLALAAATALVADLARPAAGRRGAAVLLGLAAVLTHVYYALQFLLVFPALGLLLAWRSQDRKSLRRGMVTVLLMALCCAPYLGFRAGQAYAPVNVIHTAPQGLLYLGDHLRVVSIGVLWDWLGLLWVALPFLLVWVARHSAGRPAWSYLVAAGAAPLLVMFVPPVVELLQPRLGYLLMRMVWMVPQAALLALAALALVRRARAGPGPGRPLAWATLAALLALAAPALLDSARVLAGPRSFRAEEEAHSALLWKDALAWMDQRLPPGTVVLADPVTSYSVPMMTRHFVATLVDQHSSPNDPRALERILDARDALDPYGAWRRTLEVLRRYDVGAIALNDRFARYVGLDYWAPYTGFVSRVRRRFDAEPRWFPLLYDSAGFVVYGVRRPLPDSLPESAVEPPWLAERLPPSVILVPDSTASAARLVGLDFERPAGPLPLLGRGDTLWGACYWVPERPVPAASYAVSLRFDLEGYRVPAPFAWAAKPWRKVEEGVRGVRYRFRHDHLPGEGQFNLDRWPPGRLVRDPFSIPVPYDVAPGVYRVQVRLLAPPGHYPNYRLSDYFSDMDYYSGIAVARIQVAAPDSVREVH